MNNGILKISITLGFIFFLLGCAHQTEYESMVQQGLNSDREINDIFLGYEFGMTREEFLQSSWEMNQQEIITGGVKIVYLLEELKSTARLEFYPEFENGVIAEMPVTASYISWAPWNDEYNAENLLNDIKLHYEDVFETSFQSVSLPEIEENVWVSIEGNREIRMYKKSVNTVQINFIDLSKIYQNS